MGKAKILLVEDSQGQAEKTIKTLRENGYDVEWAKSGIPGLKAAKNTKPDIILLDVVMPDIDGYTVCRWLKLNNETREIPIIMLTVKGEVGEKVEGLEAGANDYLPKPFDERELEARIYSAIRTRSLQNELRKSNEELKRLLEKVELMAITDPLTGLYNRRRFYESLKKEFAFSKRYKHPVSCIMLDIDHFKKINDTYGHQAGDLILKGLSDIMKRNIRETDMVARYGGEEFIILLPHTMKKDALKVADNMINKVREKVFDLGNDKTLKITISMGISSITDFKQDANQESMIKTADSALYTAKETGRDRIEVYSHQ
ncbi:MAG: diguanylate cyclase [Thermodesulfobacteriota bacterium]